MKGKGYLVVVLMLSLVLVSTTVAGPPDPKSSGGVGPAQTMFTSLSNSFIRLDEDDDGQFVIGTTGGDPTITTDNDKRLLYGFYSGGTSSIWSSFSSVRVVTGATTVDTTLEDMAPTQGPTNNGSSITTVWTVAPNIQVKQTLTLMTNPFSGSAGTVKVEYTVTNLDSVTHGVGVRCMLDVMVGDNDAAPYFVPGVGNSNKEQEYTSANMPAYYFAFESPTYAADSLKGQGLLTGFGLTTPDRFLIASWTHIYGTIWDYTIDPNVTTGDSATAMYWNPVTLAGGQSATFATAYGLGGKGGSSTWISAPVLVSPSTTNINVTVWVNNTTLVTFANGTATIALPAGLQLHAGETAAKALGDVGPGTVKQANWSVDITGGKGTYDYSVTSTFVSGSGPLIATAKLVVGEIGYVYLPISLK